MVSTFGSATPRPAPKGGLKVFVYGATAGHAGHATVEHAFRTLPSMIKQALESLLRSFRGHAAGGGGFSAAISGMLSDCVVRFDHSITTDFTRIFPGGPAAVQGMSSTQIRHLLFQDRGSSSTMSGGHHPPAAGGSQQDLTAVTRCLQGSTVIVTLTDPSKHNLWIANLGDSQTGTVVFYHYLHVFQPTLIFQFLRLVRTRRGAGPQRS